MTYALDHVFVCCAEGAPEADRLLPLAAEALAATGR